MGVFDSLSFQFPAAINLCLGDSALVAVTDLSGGLEPYLLEWSSSAFAVDYQQAVSSQFLAPSLPTTYCVAVEDACETPGIQACVDIYVPEDVDAGFEADVISGCFPLQVVFEGVASDPSTIASAEWQFGDGITSTDVDSTSHSYGEIGFYTVTYSIVTEYGCEFEHTEDSLIRVNPWPIAEFAADLGSKPCLETVLSLPITVWVRFSTSGISPVSKPVWNLNRVLFSGGGRRISG